MADNKENIKASKFIYRDKFSRNGWLNMMQERLILARQLLKDDGVIFVSIDDSEQSYLKVLMDEIFGEDNFITSMPFISNLKGRQVNVNFAKTHEYILVYKMNNFDFNTLDEKYINSLMPSVYNTRDREVLNDNKGDYILLNTLENSNWKFNNLSRPNLFYPIYIYKDENGKYNISLNKNKEKYIELWPKSNGENLYKVWRWSKEKIEKDKNDLEVVKRGNQYYIYTKKREFDFTPKSLLLGQKLNNKNGNDLLSSLIDKNSFNTAKPLDLIKFIMKLHQSKNIRILDFFAGSGTTGHAVLELNREDGGNRTYTLVTNNENNIGENITYERLYRINTGKGTKGETFDWLKKNKPYADNLDVFYEKTYKIGFNSKMNTSDLVKIIKKELNDFGIKTNRSDDDYLLLLRNLKALVDEKDTNEVN
nr:site-specific DNA-methyltransferase [Mycoplasmopsis sturni]